jgi:Bacterial membrane protein YfhO
MNLRRIHPDVLAIVLLLFLWLFFFWRIFTPIEADQASLKMGDFSGQFVTFAGYQYARFASGEVPLWNPYNNGGLPFIADTQAAVFYPPRLITIALASLSGGWSYNALQLEMTFHVLLYSLFMYAFVRRLTLGREESQFAAVTGAIIGSYGGFMTGYAPLQLAILEAVTWLPLALLGIHEAAGHARPQYKWLVLSGVAYGIAWLAGHPQTSFFTTYLLLAYWGWRIYAQRYRWMTFVSGAALFGLLGAGIAVVQLIPGVEYLAQTTRVGFGYDDKGNGFPIQDIIQFIFPNVVSLFSPLYVGVTALVLAAIALWKRAPQALFWGAVLLIALVWSFGANSILYPALYNTLPGLRFFRGQERAALLVVNSLAILAALGVVTLASWKTIPNHHETLRRALRTFAFIVGGISAILFVAWLGNREDYDAFVGYFALSTIVTMVLAFAIPHLIHTKRRNAWLSMILGLVIFELFTVTMDSPATYDSNSSAQQLSMTLPPIIAQVLDDPATPFRVDGFRGLGDNYGSLYGLMDIRGISPLFLNRAHAIIEGDLPDQMAWELFAARYVYTDWNELPVPSEIIGQGTDRFGAINVHQLDNPRPFALLVNDYRVASEADTLTMLADPSFNPRSSIILNSDPQIDLSTVPTNVNISITNYQPELIELTVETDQSTLLSIAQLDYPGWHATIDDQTTPILRAYGALMALAIERGEHTITLRYDPITYRIGAFISIISLVSILAFGIVQLVNRRSA